MSIRYLFWFWYAVGLLMMLTTGVPEWLAFSNGLFLLFYALYALEIEAGLGEPRGRRLTRAAWVAGITFLVEYIGVSTGFPFGEYAYTPVLGWAVGGVPLAIACAWVGVIMNAVVLSEQSSRWRRAVMVGLWVVVFDLVLDPVAYAKDFWIWEHTGGYFGVPATNFVSWFVIAFVASLAFPVRSAPYPVRRSSARLLQGMLLMFGLLGLKEGIPAALFIAIGGAVAAEGVLRFDLARAKRKVHPSVRVL
ncbi:carotenoid biosynthesis protein [Paenibacillus sp. PL2-23]|uniref:carotenoid biosynthesis protein n=1 Tax=Paenibacillus sp. PL2-23 TaxID=2100729 RepID=UPI0030FC1A56